jgi:hypothetical protein
MAAPDAEGINGARCPAIRVAALGGEEDEVGYARLMAALPGTRRTTRWLGYGFVCELKADDATGMLEKSCLSPVTGAGSLKTIELPTLENLMIQLSDPQLHFL